MSELAKQSNLVSTVPVMTVNPSKEEIEQELQVILNEVAKTVKLVGTLQERLHNRVIIPSIIHAWKHKDSTIIKHVLNGLLPVKASVRIESMAFWFMDIAGIDVKYEEAKGSFIARFVKDKSAKSKTNGHSYNYDLEHLAICKQENLRYWKVAPVKISIPTLPESLDAAFDGIEKTLAKAMLVGHFSTEDIAEYIANKLMKNATHYQADDKIRDWAVDYMEVHSKKETEV